MEVRQLGVDEVAPAADVLTEAFLSYPMGKYVLGSSPDYPMRLRSFLTFFVRGTILRDEWLFGVGAPDGLKAVAATARAHAQSPTELLDLREALWAELGDEARSRYEAAGRASARLSIDEPHFHLILIGVRAAYQWMLYRPNES